MNGTANDRLINAYLQGLIDAKLNDMQNDSIRTDELNFNSEELRDELRHMLENILTERGLGEDIDGGGGSLGVLPDGRPPQNEPQPNPPPVTVEPEPVEEDEEEEDIIEEEPDKPSEPLWLSILKTILITLAVVAALYFLFYLCFIRRAKKDVQLPVDGDMNLPAEPTESNMNLPDDSTDDKK